jgi:acetyl esterase
MENARAVDRLRRRAGQVAIRSMFEGLSRAGRLLPQSAPHRHGVEVLRDVPYGPAGAPWHTLDVYRPVERPGLLPVVLYVHGGAFCILSKDTHWVMGLSFARRGHVVFNINYRLAPEHRFPAGLEDTCRALLWVQENAARFGGDPSRIAFAGESAGANLVTSLAIAAHYRRPEPWARAVFDAAPPVRAVMPACGILQVTDPERITRRKPHMSPWVADRLLEVHHMYLPRPAPPGLDLTLADPLVFLERAGPPDRPLPPFHALVGTRDPLLDDTRRLASALSRLGATAEARYYVGGMHAFHALVGFDPLARMAWRDQLAFLERHLSG